MISLRKRSSRENKILFGLFSSPSILATPGFCDSPVTSGRKTRTVGSPHWGEPSRVSLRCRTTTLPFSHNRRWHCWNWPATSWRTGLSSQALLRPSSAAPGFDLRTTLGQMPQIVLPMMTAADEPEAFLEVFLRGHSRRASAPVQGALF